MLPALARHERDFELRRTQSQHVVRDVLPRRPVDADLQRALSGTANVNYNMSTNAQYRPHAAGQKLALAMRFSPRNYIICLI